jgi:mono/diheme cytochrome c family protein
MKIKAILTIGIIAISSILLSCSNEEGRVYMPDMNYSRAYEFYSDNEFFKSGITAQQPVQGTIARGALLPDHIGEFDTNAAKLNKYGGTLTLEDVTEGGRIYQIHCGVCHGTNLDGNGPLYNGGEGKYPAKPANFKDEKYLNMNVGTMYHAIMYGKNLMGSYASQLDGKQRWMVLAYIKKVQGENGGAPITTSFNIQGAEPVKASADAAVNESKEATKVEAVVPATKDAADAIKEAAKSTKEIKKDNKK